MCSSEVYEVEIEELYNGMSWPEPDGSVPEKKVSNNTAVSSTFLVQFNNFPWIEFIDFN